MAEEKRADREQRHRSLAVLQLSLRIREGPLVGLRVSVPSVVAGH